VLDSYCSWQLARAARAARVFGGVVKIQLVGTYYGLDVYQTIK
jgi:hypothetical protein